VPRGNGHIGKKSAGQNARRWMTNSCLWNIMTKTWVVHSAQLVPKELRCWHIQSFNFCCVCPM
jgi:hypothetical protein